MSSKFEIAKAGLIASSLSLLMSQTAFAGITDIHIPTPSVHISVPTPNVHVSTGNFKAPVFNNKTGTTVEGNGRGDLASSGRNKSGQATGVSTLTATVSGKSGRDWPRGNGGNGSSNQNSADLSGVTLPGSIVQPPGVGNNATLPNGLPPGVYNPNCDGAADCPPVTGPVQVVGDDSGNNGGTTIVDNWNWLPPAAVDALVGNLEAANYFVGTRCTLIDPANTSPSGEPTLKIVSQDGPPNGDSVTVTVTLNGVTMTATISDPDGPGLYIITINDGGVTYMGRIAWQGTGNGSFGWYMSGMYEYNAQGQIIGQWLYASCTF